MAVLEWDQVGERFYQAGLDRGVLYLADGTVVPWNGLTAVEDSTTRETKSYYMDGVKYLEYQLPGEFTGSIKAFTYPDEFEAANGVRTHAPGFFVHDQPTQSFGLSYRTLLGNDVDGLEYGYRVHVLWNLLATPSSLGLVSLSRNVTPTEFSWSLTATPEHAPEVRPTAHVSFRSTDLAPASLEALEEVLYGTETTNPILPSLADTLSLALTGELNQVTITNNGDDTWTASGNAVTEQEDGKFQIANITPAAEDANSFTLNTTE